MRPGRDGDGETTRAGGGRWSTPRAVGEPAAAERPGVLVAAMRRGEPGAFTRFVERYHRVLLHFHEHFFDMDLRDDVSRIEVPTLVLAGRDDPMTPYELSSEILGRLASGLGQLEIVDGAGHGVHRDQPERTEQILRRFLAS